MRHLRPTTTVLTALVLSLWGLTACSGGGGGDDEDDDAAGCAPGTSRVSRVLVDDRAALPAGNWVPVVSTRGDFRDRLAALDEVSRAVSGDDVRAVADAESGGDRRTALEKAVADVPRARGGSAGRLQVVAQEEPDGEAVAELWAAGLERRGARAGADVATAADALVALADRDADVALLGLDDLAGEVDAELPEGGDPSAQVQAVAQAALEQDLALGATSSATTAAQVLVTEGLATEAGLTTLGDLAEACPGALIAATEDAVEDAATLAEAYGFEVADEPVTSAEETLGAEGSDVLAVVTSD